MVFKPVIKPNQTLHIVIAGIEPVAFCPQPPRSYYLRKASQRVFPGSPPSLTMRSYMNFAWGRRRSLGSLIRRFGTPRATEPRVEALAGSVLPLGSHLDSSAFSLPHSGATCGGPGPQPPGPLSDRLCSGIPRWTLCSNRTVGPT